MEWPVIAVVGIFIALLIFVAVFGPNKVKGKQWRGERRPSALLGPDKEDPPDSRRY